MKKLCKQLDSAEELVQGGRSVRPSLPTYSAGGRLTSSLIRYQDAIGKFEAVMRTEADVPYYTNLAKEKICFCLVKVSSFELVKYSCDVPSRPTGEDGGHLGVRTWS